MVEIRVGVADADGAQGLLQRLAAFFDRSSVSFDATRNQVRVRSDKESRSVVRVIDAVESWLAADGVESAELSLGERSYTMVGPSGGTARSSVEKRRVSVEEQAAGGTDRGCHGIHPTLNRRYPWSP
jgi:hypothetical protein